MELEDMIKAYLEKALAAEQAPAQPEGANVQKAQAPEAVTKNELSEILAGFAQTVNDGVQKALEAQAPAREPGAGRKGVEKNAAQGEQPEDEVAALVRKAVESKDALDAYEKEALWRMTYEYLTAGLRA